MGKNKKSKTKSLGPVSHSGGSDIEKKDSQPLSLSLSQSAQTDTSNQSMNTAEQDSFQTAFDGNDAGIALTQTQEETLAKLHESNDAQPMEEETKDTDEQAKTDSPQPADEEEPSSQDLTVVTEPQSPDGISEEPKQEPVDDAAPEEQSQLNDVDKNEEGIEETRSVGDAAEADESEKVSEKEQEQEEEEEVEFDAQASSKASVEVVDESNQSKEEEKEVREEDAPIDQRLVTAGTPEQTEIIDDYPTQQVSDKLRVPYIERYNGNICVKKQDYERAVAHYNKSLLGLKLIFQGNNGTGEQYVTDREQAIKLIMDIETPTQLNLALCYIKLEQFHFAIKYTGNVLENDPENTKALYRRGVAYTKIGELDKARDCLQTALENESIDAGEKQSIVKALTEIKAKEKKDRQSEIEMSKRMIKSTNSQAGQQVRAGAGDPKEAAAPASADTADKESKSEQAPQETAQAAQPVLQQQKSLFQTCWKLLTYIISFVIFSPVHFFNAIVFVVKKYFDVLFLCLGKVFTKGWSIFVSVTSHLSKVFEGLPVIGKFLAWLLAIPSKIRLPQQGDTGRLAQLYSMLQMLQSLRATLTN